MIEKQKDHVCGRVLDYCQWRNYKLFFCVFCKKVLNAVREEEIEITIKFTDKPLDEYDDDTLEELK